MERLSGKVACYLLDSALVPNDHISYSLIDTCAVRIFSRGPEEAFQKSKYRIAILERLFARGLVLTTSSEYGESTMYKFLKTVESSTMRDWTCNGEVPLDAETLCILCDYGGDVVSEFDRCRSFHGDAYVPPEWLTEYVNNVRADEELIQSMLQLDPFSADIVQQLLEETAKDILAVRDRSGRYLLHIAAVSGNVDFVKWLVQDKGAYINKLSLDGFTIRELCEQLGQTAVVHFVDSLTISESARDEHR